MCENMTAAEVAAAIATGLVILGHARTLLPPQAQGVVGVLLKVGDVVLENYGGAKNAPKPADEQDRVTPRPKAR